MCHTTGSAVKAEGRPLGEPVISPLRDLLRGALERAGVETASDLWQVGDAWEKAVGPTVAAHAQPAGLVRGELLVASPDAVWRQELTLLTPDIKQKVNAALGRAVVDRVRIVSGTVAAPDERSPDPGRSRTRATESQHSPGTGPRAQRRGDTRGRR